MIWWQESSRSELSPLINMESTALPRKDTKGSCRKWERNGQAWLGSQSNQNAKVVRIGCSA